MGKREKCAHKILYLNNRINNRTKNKCEMPKKVNLGVNEHGYMCVYMQGQTRSNAVAYRP